MPFTVEDGSGKADANGAITVEFANDYHSTRGRTDWGSLSETKKQASIVLATDFFKREYAAKIAGIRFLPTQRLPFPIRLQDGTAAPIPYAYQEAIAELAYIAKDSEFINTNKQQTGWLIEKTTDVLTTRWAPGEGMPGSVNNYTWLDDMLAGLLTTSGRALNYVERA